MLDVVVEGSFVGSVLLAVLFLVVFHTAGLIYVLEVVALAFGIFELLVESVR